MKRFALLAVSLLALPGMAGAQGAKKPKTPVKPPIKAQDATKGQTQQQGGDGVFKTIYTLKDGFNFTILSAKYSVEPYNAYESEFAGADEKFLILTVAIKNANPDETFFNGEGMEFTAVDDKMQNYSGHNYRLASLGVKGFGPTVKPGQGYGRDPRRGRIDGGNQDAFQRKDHKNHPQEGAQICTQRRGNTVFCGKRD